MEYKLKTNDIVNLIYVVRGQQVMLDCDLAKLYHCKNGTKSLNLAVKRNIERFPNDFCFQLTKEEYDNLKFQFETSSSNNTYVELENFLMFIQKKVFLNYHQFYILMSQPK